MIYLETKKQILELKLALVNLQMEKNLIIKEQQYEKAADCRDQERTLKEELHDLKVRLNHELEGLKLTPGTMEQTYLLMNLLSEFNHDETSKTFASIRNSFMERLKMEYEELWNERKKLQKEFRFSDAQHIHEQIMEIGRFLVRYGT